MCISDSGSTALAAGSDDCFSAARGTAGAVFTGGALLNGTWKLVEGDWFGWGVWLGPDSPNGTASGAETTPGADAGCPAGCLFDLAADPGEHVDLKGAQPERFAAMRARLASWGATVYQTNYSDVDDDAACLDTDALLARYGGFLGPPCGLGAVR